jgi:hypothetical protein
MPSSALAFPLTVRMVGFFAFLKCFMSSRFELVGSLALFFQILEAISQRRYALFCGEIHESGKRGSGIVRRHVPAIPYPRDREFRGPLYIHGFHSTKLQCAEWFVMTYLNTLTCKQTRAFILHIVA